MVVNMIPAAKDLLNFIDEVFKIDFHRFFQTLLRDSSYALHAALDGRVYFKSYTVVIPSSWRDAKCETVVRPPRAGVPYRQADVVVTASDHRGDVFTQQSRGCGQLVSTS